jgi:hypothetical protein
MLAPCPHRAAAPGPSASTALHVNTDLPGVDNAASAALCRASAGTTCRRRQGSPGYAEVRLLRTVRGPWAHVLFEIYDSRCRGRPIQPEDNRRQVVLLPWLEGAAAQACDYAPGLLYFRCCAVLVPPQIIAASVSGRAHRRARRLRARGPRGRARAGLCRQSPAVRGLAVQGRCCRGRRVLCRE